MSELLRESACYCVRNEALGQLLNEKADWIDSAACATQQAEREASAMADEEVRRALATIAKLDAGFAARAALAGDRRFVWPTSKAYLKEAVRLYDETGDLPPDDLWALCRIAEAMANGMEATNVEETQWKRAQEFRRFQVECFELEQEYVAHNVWRCKGWESVSDWEPSDGIPDDLPSPTPSIKDRWAERERRARPLKTTGEQVTLGAVKQALKRSRVDYRKEFGRYKHAM